MDGRKSRGQDSRLLLLEKKGVHRDNTSRPAIRLVTAELRDVVLAAGSASTNRTDKPRAAAALPLGGSGSFSFQQGHQAFSQVRAHVLIDPLHKGVADGHG